MGNFNALLSERLKKTDNTSKMAALARQSAKGNLTSFSGVFSVVELSDKEKANIESILKEYALDHADLSADLSTMISITSEVKAINNQAALLHGERIKKAHQVLTRYRNGAFTAWLLAAYGNRQTPYNLMQYYLFCEALPKALRPQIEAMPRQAVYTLASRDGALEKKRGIIENYKGETKTELLSQIRKAFPLETKDRRMRDFGDIATRALKRLREDIRQSKPLTLTKTQKKGIFAILAEIQELIDMAKIYEVM